MSYDSWKTTPPDDPDAPRADDQRGPQVCAGCGRDCEEADYDERQHMHICRWCAERIERGTRALLESARKAG